MDNDERLARIETLLEGMDKKLDEAHVRQDRVNRVLWGVNGAPGVLVRLDRVEQGRKAGTWVLRTVVVAVVGIAAGLLTGLLG